MTTLDSPALTAALSYAARGWRVFPLHTVRADRSCSCGARGCSSKGKHPRTQRGVHDATTDTAQINAWWSEWPGANVGIATGALADGRFLVVLDEDPRHGGDETRAALEAENGAIPDTLRVLTGGGGTHYFFVSAVAQTNSAGRIGPGLDVRCVGGYVVAAPSNHESGRAYAWDAGAAEEIAEWPAWLRVLNEKSRPIPSDAANDSGAIATGSRDQTLTSIAGSMRRKGLTAEEIRPALAAVNARRCKPPLADRDIDRIATSVARYDAAQPIVAAAADPSWDSLVTSVPENWYSSPPPPRTWLLRDARRDCAGVLPLGKTGQLIAAGGVGKTMALLSLAVAVATGSRWLDTFEVASSGRVLMCLGEEDTEEVHRRLHAAARAAGRTPAPDAIVALPLAGVPCSMLEHDERRNLTETAFLPWLRDYLEANASDSDPWRLVVFDPLSRFAGPDAEIDNAAATRFVAAVESLATLTGATVLVAHHTNKTSRTGGAIDGNASRGSSALHDGFRWQAALAPVVIEGIEDPTVRDRLGEIVALTFTKSNYARRAETLRLRRDERGALVPLDETDEQLLAPALASGSARRAREKRAEREERENAKREERERARADREAAAAAKRSAADRALLDAVKESPGLTEDRLLSQMRARLGAISDDAAKSAIARLQLASRIEVKGGPKNAKCHFLKVADGDE